MPSLLTLLYTLKNRLLSQSFKLGLDCIPPQDADLCKILAAGNFSLAISKLEPLWAFGSVV